MLKRLSPRSEFIKHVLTLVTGTAISQAIMLALYPVLSRLYSPDEWGTFGSFMSIASAISVLACLRYDVAIILPKEDKEAANILALCGCITGIVAFLTAIGVIVARTFMDISPKTAATLYFLPVFVFFLSCYQALASWANRNQKYKSIVYSRVSNSAGTVSVNLAGGLMKAGTAGLLFGNIFGQILSTLLLFFSIFRKAPAELRSVDKNSIRAVLKKYSQFPKINMPQAIIDMLQLNGVVYLVSYFFSAGEVGAYFFGMRILQAPVGLVGAAFAQVFYRKAAEVHNTGQTLQPLVRKTILRMALLGSPMLLGLLFLGPDLFAFAFGEKWRTAGEYARILAPWMFFDFIRMPISQVPLIINKQKVMFYLSLIGNLILFGSLLYGGLVKDVKIGFALLSGLISLHYIIIITWIYSTSKHAAV